MHSPQLDSNAPSPPQDLSVKPSSIGSNPTRKRPKKTSEPPIPSPQTNGYPSSTDKNLLEIESVNSSSSRQEKLAAPPASSLLDKRKRSALALRRLKVDPEELARTPQITPILKDTRGGLRTLLKAIRFASEDQDLQKFLEVYDSIPPSDLPHLSWEAICLAAGVNTKHFCGAAQVAAVTFFGSKSRMVAVSSHPSITKARVKYALMPSGEKDRNAIDVMVGALPSAKGPTFIGKAIFGGGRAAEDDDEDETTVDAAGIFGPDDDISDIFPPAKDIQQKIIPVVQRLTDGKKSE